MLSLDDPRWEQLQGGYRVPQDMRPLLKALEANWGPSTWDSLWQELHHQGDVGEASFACVPHLVRLYLGRGQPDWNIYGLVATIELARKRGRNPDVPGWLREGYVRAIDELAHRGLADLEAVTAPEAVQSILGILALWKGAHTYGRVLVEFTEDEVLELEEQAFGSSNEAP